MDLTIFSSIPDALQNSPGENTLHGTVKGPSKYLQRGGENELAIASFS
jgi:hypothetical protein